MARFSNTAGSLVCALALALHSLTAWAAVPNEFTFNDPGHYSNLPLTVYYYKAKSASADSKILFAIHGAERNGKRALANWIGFAERHGLIVVAPEFSREHFPNRLFQLGGMDQRDPSKWTFSIIENIFEKIRRDEHLKTSSYILFGHSAGAQFVHRFMLVMEKPRVSVAIAANAGSYMPPAYPDQAFRRNLIVMLGEQDILTGGPNFPRSPEALAQGATRLERGKNFFAKAKAQAEQSGAAFKWQLMTVPGAGHNAEDMAKAAAKALFY